MWGSARMTPLPAATASRSRCSSTTNILATTSSRDIRGSRNTSHQYRRYDRIAIRVSVRSSWSVELGLHPAQVGPQPLDAPAVPQPDGVRDGVELRPRHRLRHAPHDRPAGRVGDVDDTVVHGDGVGTVGAGGAGGAGVGAPGRDCRRTSYIRCPTVTVVAAASPHSPIARRIGSVEQPGQPGQHEDRRSAARPAPRCRRSRSSRGSRRGPWRTTSRPRPRGRRARPRTA